MFDVYIVFALLLEWWLTPDEWACPKAPHQFIFIEDLPLCRFSNLDANDSSSLFSFSPLSCARRLKA